MEQKKKETLEELIDVAPEESETEKEDPEKLDLEEPRKRPWLRLIVWVIVLAILGGVSYTVYLVYQGNQKSTSSKEKIEGNIDLDNNNQTETTPKYVYVNTSDGLNLRESPDPNSQVIMVVPDKAQLTLVKEDSQWDQVTYNGQTGYVYASFVTTALPPAQ